MSAWARLKAWDNERRVRALASPGIKDWTEERAREVVRETAGLRHGDRMPRNIDYAVITLLAAHDRELHP